MKKYIGVIVVMVEIMFTACAQTRTANSRAKISKSKTISAISFSRGACFGRCPIYTLSIKRNGTAVFEGRNATEFLGTYEKQYRPEAVAEVFERAQDYRVDTLQQKYDVTISDLPGLDFTFTINGKEQLVHNAGFGPRYLLNFANYLDQTIKVDSSWRKIKDLEPQQ